MSRLAPSRRRGFEYIDDPAMPDALRQASMRDLVRSNTWLGGSHALLAELACVLPPAGSTVTLLDVGTGLGDLPVRARRAAGQRGVQLVGIGLDASALVLRSARTHLASVAAGDARALPFATDAVDLVTCSQLLHHFEESDARAVLRELHRVARRAVIVSDLRRSPAAAVGFWLASLPLRFHAVTRHDGVTSVLRGFTSDELGELIEGAVGVSPHVSRHAGYRLTARWLVPDCAA